MLHRVLSITLTCAVAASCAYWLIAWWTTRRFFTKGRLASENFSPPVSILKPLKGTDARAHENVRSFCEQEYPQYELLFGVADANDPAVELIQRLQSAHPDRAIRLVVAEPLGANPKSSTLQRLAAEASGEVLVISDADIRVTSGYLTRVVAPLADPGVGLVTCPYRGTQAQTLAARLEALHMDVTFLPSAILAHELLGQCVGMGATLALRKSDLERLGGYASFRDHLLDDYQLADRVRKLGLRTVISDCVVQSVLGPTKFVDQWNREVRWARGIRITKPASYPGLLLTYPMVLAVLLVAVHPLHWDAWALLAGSLLLRTLVAWDIAGLVAAASLCAKAAKKPRSPRPDVARAPRPCLYENKENMGEAPMPPIAPAAFSSRRTWCLGGLRTGESASDRGYLYLLPLREVLSFSVWCAGLIGKTVIWRGQTFQLLRYGRLKIATNVRRDPLSRLVRRLDQFLRRREGIFEFSVDADCMFRVSIGPCEAPIALRDGATLAKGDTIADLHFWNEHMPTIPAGGGGLAWAQAILEQSRRSLNMLAGAVERDTRFDGVKAFRGKSVLTPRGGTRQLQRLADKVQFELREPILPPTPLRKLHDWGENLLIWALVWTSNPGGLRGAKLNRRRTEWWISRERLLERYDCHAEVFRSILRPRR